MAKYNLRDLPKQKFDDDDQWLMSSQARKTKTSYPCKGCELVFTNEKAAILHQTGCMTVKVDLSRQGSFFNGHFSENQIQQNNAEKILPLSQPLGELRERIENESNVSSANIGLEENDVSENNIHTQCYRYCVHPSPHFM